MSETQRILRGGRFSGSQWSEVGNRGVFAWAFPPLLQKNIKSRESEFPPTEEGRKRGRRWRLLAKPFDKAIQLDLE